MKTAARHEEGWRLVARAAAGGAVDQTAFVVHYRPEVRRLLHSRWRHSPLRDSMEDALQEVLLECFRPDGVLQRADPRRGVEFEPFLRGVVRKVACRFERREARRFARFERLRQRYGGAASEEDPGRLLDQAWARSRIWAAVDLVDRMQGRKGRTQRPLSDLLRLHFADGLPLHVIAALWGENAAKVRGMHRVACRCFRQCLLRAAGPELSAPGDADKVGRELLALLSS